MKANHIKAKIKPPINKNGRDNRNIKLAIKLNIMVIKISKQ